MLSLHGLQLSYSLFSVLIFSVSGYKSRNKNTKTLKHKNFKITRSTIPFQWALSASGLGLREMISGA